MHSCRGGRGDDGKAPTIADDAHKDNTKIGYKGDGDRFDDSGFTHGAFMVAEADPIVRYSDDTPANGGMRVHLVIPI